MSAIDITTSIAMLFTTTPMPADVNDTYNFATGSSGSKGACSAQGFVIVIGGTLAILSNAALSLFYIGSLHVGMTSGKINKRMLYPLFGLGVVFNIAIAVLLLRLDLLNPQPFEPFCFVGSYPMGCNDNEDAVCIGGANSSRERQTILITAALYFSICVSAMTSSLALFVYKLYKISLAITSLTKAITDNENSPQSPSNDIALAENSSEEGSNERTSLAVVLRVPPPPPVVEVDNVDALEEHLKGLNTLRSQLCHGNMYIIAFILTWIWVLIDLGPRRRASQSTSWPAYYDHLKMIFLPLQGFLNALIFFSQKLWVMRHSYDNNDTESVATLSLLDLVKRIILSPRDNPSLPDLGSIVQDVAGVSVVQRHREFRNISRGEFSSSGGNAFPYDGNAGSSGTVIGPGSEPLAELHIDHQVRSAHLHVHGSPPFSNTTIPNSILVEGVARAPSTTSPHDDMDRNGSCPLPTEGILEEPLTTSSSPPLYSDRKVAALSDKISSFGVTRTDSTSLLVKDDKKTIELSNCKGGSPEVVRRSPSSASTNDDKNRNVAAVAFSNEVTFKIDEIPALHKLFHNSLLRDQFSAEKKRRAHRRPVHRRGSIGSGQMHAVHGGSTIAVRGSAHTFPSENFVETTNNNAENVAGDSPAASNMSNNPTQSEASDLELDVDPELNEEEEESDYE